MNAIVKKLILAIMNNRFEPVETVLALSVMLHGFWLLLPQLGNGIVLEAIAFSRTKELVGGAVMVLFGMISLFAIGQGNNRFLATVDFAEFLGWFYLATLAFAAAGFASLLWVPYITLAALSAFVYLGVSVGGQNGT
ncbi:MAG: hypothetical protein LC650_00180 [Actinobacteria bacterium]|nr:hypothetical protein [Actinomycetota bacterium]